jgi:hypothetical protein
MSESLTPEEMRAKIIADLMAQPGPKPLKPIPPEVMAELMADDMPPEEAERAYKELMEKGGVSIEPYLEELRRKYPAAK